MYDFTQYDEIKSSIFYIDEQIKNLYDSLKIEKLNSEKDYLDSKVLDSKFYDDIDDAQKILKKLSNINELINNYNKLKSELEDLKVLLELSIEEKDSNLLKEILKFRNNLESKVEKGLISSLLKDEYDKNDSIMTLHAGAGGTEAQDWVQMLLRMYTRWAENRRYKIQILDILMGDEAGVKSVTILIEGLNAYGYTKSEKGIHRLVRISPFDASNRRHTSFASVEVMPKIDKEIQIEICPEELRIDTFRASGAGGQHINKTDSAVRITHIPSGIVVSCQNQRSQHQNRDVAMTMLKAKLFEREREEQQAKLNKIRGEQKEIGWGNQIRSYVFCPYTMVKDHRTNCEIGNVNAVMDGEINKFIDEYLKWVSQ